MDDFRPWGRQQAGSGRGENNFGFFVNNGNKLPG
jgi:hypothetical protein